MKWFVVVRSGATTSAYLYGPFWTFVQAKAFAKALEDRGWITRAVKAMDPNPVIVSMSADEMEGLA